VYKKGSYGAYSRLINNMNFGDSVLVDNRTQAIGFRITAKRYGFKVIQRKDGCQIRIWKVGEL